MTLRKIEGWSLWLLVQSCSAASARMLQDVEVHVWH